MKIEKINENQVKIFVSSSDLQDREISVSDLWSNGPKVRNLFWEMMEMANSEVGFDLEGRPMVVEAYGIPPEGFFVIITKGEDGHNITDYISDKWLGDINTDEYSDDDDEISENEMDVMLGDPLNIIYSFENFDNACYAVQRIPNLSKGDISLYLMNGKYHLVVATFELDDEMVDIIETNFSEFGDEQLFTEDFLIEHGKLIVDGEFLKVAKQYLG
jgi:adapter protein MecA 1/2